MAIAAGIAGVAQAGIVAAQKFQPETFEDGGRIVDGASHSAGGVEIAGGRHVY